MYNLIMHGIDEWTKGIVLMPRDRFLKHTDEDLLKRFGDPNEKTISELSKLPSLFTSEMPTNIPPRVGRICKVKDQGAVLRIEFTPIENLSELDPKRVAALMLELDIRRAETHTTHWAVKDVDLFQVLQRAGLWRGAPLDPGKVEFSRRTIICACNLLETHFTHAKLNQFLQEIGMEHSPAAPNVGGLQLRLAELSGYAITCPSERTASGLPLSYVIVERAAELDHAASEREIAPDGDRPVRREFLASLAKDGYVFSDHSLYASSPDSSTAFDVLHQAFPNQSEPENKIHMAKNYTETFERAKVASPLFRPKIFVVHGRDDAAKHEVARFLERIGLDATILHEQANGGRTLITKFQEVAKDVAFAVVLMTPDDEGALMGETQRPRARQNVVFELGFFLGRMPEGRVCALVKSDLERPSDYDGVAYIPLDANGGWKTQLMRELKHANIPFNADHALY
ncbi:TIR domain-containing protein [Duganella vulcania]|uniref:CD-NTase-associated protein 12/Pycsar effector protein TIR domain-containing protein n=1 Tax=Duganella vulcania TaxID=2692166 RepID=A0A845GSG2_9BURK|nr:nucleotide-binding protein [Duganella vulcania]MYM96625.1 hypothetical protein [Duganella vulcania]